VLRLVDEGLRLEFSQPPAVRRLGPVFRGSLQHKTDLIATLHKWLNAGVIERVPDALLTTHNFSLLFPVKQGKKFRWCLDARHINAHLDAPRIRMAGVKTIRSLLPAGAWLVTIDLESAYLHVPVHRGDRRWLAFQALGRNFRFCSMLFGLNIAPSVFTALLKPVLALLHKMGVCCSIYLDDLLVWAPTKLSARLAARCCKSLLEDLGFIVNDQKSMLEPRQIALYLGLEWHTTTCTIRLSTETLTELRKSARYTLNLARRNKLTVRRLAAAVGRMTAAMPAMQAAAMRRHSLERCVKLYLRTNSHLGLAAWDAPAQLSQTAKDDLLWWASRAPWRENGRPFRTPTPTATLTTDASATGWGAVWATATMAGPPQTAHDVWLQSNLARSSNWKETTGIVMGYFQFINQLKPYDALLIRTDNTTALSILRRFGSRIPALGKAMQPLLLHATANNIFLSSEHVRGVDNSAADWLSRIGLADRNDWSLPLATRNLISRTWNFSATIDLFATHHNHIHNNYCTIESFPNPIDGLCRPSAFSIDWSDLSAWIVPPPNLLDKIVGRLLDNPPLSAVVVTPRWPSRAWYGALTAASRASLNLEFPSDLRGPTFRDGSNMLLIAWLL